jgi:hypothetical protein
MTGFVQIAVIPTFGYYSIVVGRKPGPLRRAKCQDGE